MKEFWKDYKDLCKHSIDFSKKHWKGLIVVTAAMSAAEAAYIYFQLKQMRKATDDFCKEFEAYK